MPKLFIPTVGTELVLSKPWSFTLFPEYRNESLFAFFEMKFNGDYDLVDDPTARYGYKTVYKMKPKKVTLEKGTRLKVDRIFIRKGKDEFDSITFVMPEVAKPGNKGGGFYKNVRFWVKLDDANTLEFE